MQQNYESTNAVAARCVNTSARLREFLFSGQELGWTARRDIAAAANMLVDLGLKLDKSYQGIVDTTKLLDDTAVIGRRHHERAVVAES
jgi:hypothetical protein